MNEIESRKPGSSIRLGFVRDGKPTDATVTVGDRDKVFAELNNPQANTAPDEEADAGESKLGIVVRELHGRSAAACTHKAS